MANLLDIINSPIVRLTPFFTFVLIYFVCVRDPHGELWTSILKFAPILSLMGYVVTNGLRYIKSHTYSWYILIALFFSCIGDVLLNIDLFPHGMVAFALAQICYIKAFGWKHLHLDFGIPLYITGAIALTIMYKNLTGVLVYGCPIYVLLLLTMCWRSVIRGVYANKVLTRFCAVGSVLFVISDAVIGINMFITELPNARVWTMVTYYAAQLAMSLDTIYVCQTPKYNRKYQ